MRAFFFFQCNRQPRRLSKKNVTLPVGKDTKGLSAAAIVPCCVSAMSFNSLLKVLQLISGRDVSGTQGGESGIDRNLPILETQAEPKSLNRVLYSSHLVHFLFIFSVQLVYRVPRQPSVKARAPPGNRIVLCP